LDNQLRVSYQKFHKNRTNSFSNFNERWLLV
jgi:hypothetical protein